MARKTTRRRKAAPAKKARSSKRWRLKVALVLAIFLAAAGGWSWWQLQHWTPSLEQYPEQGVAVGATDAPVSLRTTKALGARFAYLEASIGSSGRDSSFAGYFEAAREAGMQAGAVHLFDPCEIADGQSANFVTVVPRAEDMLPPVIALERTADDCIKRVSDAAVESELMTLINQIESHSGKPVILRLSPAFEERYDIANRIERNLWLSRTRVEPEYAGRPWLLWTANRALRSEASSGPIRWMVVRP